MKKCPKCGKKLAPIVYGLPTSEAAEASSRGEIFLGGCEVYPNSPKYHCYNCILDFDKDIYPHKKLIIKENYFSHLPKKSYRIGIYHVEKAIYEGNFSDRKMRIDSKYVKQFVENKQ